MTNPHIGSSFDDFLEEEGLIEKVTAEAIEEILAWQKLQAMATSPLDGGCDSPEDEHLSLFDLN